MKTPRAILFARHQAAAPKLDAIRREIVKAEFMDVGQASHLSLTSLLFRMETGATPVLRLLWRELILPSRRIWSGLAAAWVLIFIVNVSQRDGSQTIVAKSPATAPMMMSFRDQQKWLNELLADRPQPAEADRPLIIAPKPRSEVSQTATV